MKTFYDLKMEELKKHVNTPYSVRESKEIARAQRRRHLIKLFRKIAMEKGVL